MSQEAGQVVWYSHLFQNFPQSVVIHTVKGFGIVNKAEIDAFSCSHEIKRRLLLGRRVMTNLAYSKAEILLCQQSPSSQVMVFPVVMYGCESWMMKKAEV